MSRTPFLNKSRALLLGIAVAGIVGAAIIWRVTASSGASEKELSAYELAWFTTDDGRTWFPDDANKLPPFDRDGKPAHRAYVYRKPGQQPFVLFLERYTPDAIRQLNELKRQTDRPPELGIRDRIISAGVEVKKPGAKDWVKVSDPRSKEIMRARLSATDNATLEALLP